MFVSTCSPCSHDRAFMEQTCDRLLELDHAGFTATHPFGGSGSYDGFKAARAARRHAQANAAADARTLLRRESEWMARQPKVGWLAVVLEANTVLIVIFTRYLCSTEYQCACDLQCIDAATRKSSLAAAVGVQYA